jgi:hypothetical protein
VKELHLGIRSDSGQVHGGELPCADSWVFQQFDQSRYARGINADSPESYRSLLLEVLVLGSRTIPEISHDWRLQLRWRVKRMQSDKNSTGSSPWKSLCCFDLLG